MELKEYNKSEALKVMKNSPTLEKEHKAINLRDYLFLKEAVK